MSKIVANLLLAAIAAGIWTQIWFWNGDRELQHAEAAAQIFEAQTLAHTVVD
jgi:hypothetical protein